MRGGLTGTATPKQAKEAPGAGMWHEDMDGHTSDRAENSPALRAPIPTGVYRERRHGLVLWIANKANRFSLKNLTIHYASNYLDRYMSAVPVPTQKYHAIAAACMLIAAKFEERPDMVPFISEVVQEERQYHLEASDIRQFELHILKILDWRLHCKTHLHFLDMQKSQGVVSAGDRIDGLSVAEKARSKLIKYIYFFADMVLLDADLCYFAKTLSCAAIIATARLTVRMEVIWPQALAEETGFTAKDISACVDTMVSAFCRDWPDAAPDHLRNADKTPKVFNIGATSPPVADDAGVYLLCSEQLDASKALSMGRNGYCAAGENEDGNSMMVDSPRYATPRHSGMQSAQKRDKGTPLIEADSWCSSATTEIADSFIADSLML